MRKLLLTTMFVLPVAMTPVFAQDTATTPPADTTAPAAGAADAAADAADAAEDAAESSAEAAEDAANATTDTAPAADAAAQPATDAAAQPAADASDANAAALQAEMATSGKVAQQQGANELRLDWITGTAVTSPTGDTVGDINDIILDNQSGQIIAAIVGVGGFLGIGEKQIAVPWDQLTINYDAQEITTELTKEEADAAPEYVFRERQSAPAATPAAGDTTAVPADPAATPADPAATPADPATAPADGTAPASN